MRSSSPTTMPSTSCSWTSCSSLARSSGIGPVDARSTGGPSRGVVEGGGVVEQVDDARGTPPRRRSAARPGPPRRRTRGGPRPSTRSKSARSRSSLLIDDHPGQPEGGGRPPGVLGLGLDAVGGAHHHHGQVGDGQGGGQLGGEVGVAGGVEQVDLDAVDARTGRWPARPTAGAGSPRARSRRPWCPSRPSPGGGWRRWPPGAPRPAWSCPAPWWPTRATLRIDRRRQTSPPSATSPGSSRRPSSAARRRPVAALGADAYGPPWRRCRPRAGLRPGAGGSLGRLHVRRSLARGGGPAHRPGRRRRCSATGSPPTS